MSDLETRLTDALHAELPPARDAVFRVEVLVRLERARFRRHVGRTAIVALLLAVLAIVSLPAIETWMAADGRHLWFVALAATAALYAPLVLIRPGVRAVTRAVSRLLYP
jgi:hypothetical protein